MSAGHDAEVNLTCRCLCPHCYVNAGPGHHHNASTECRHCHDTSSGCTPTAPRPQRLNNGFAGMNRALVSEIASKGGKAAHAAGTAHTFSSDEARAAGRLGGKAAHAARRTRKEREDAEATANAKRQISFSDGPGFVPTELGDKPDFGPKASK